MAKRKALNTPFGEGLKAKRALLPCERARFTMQNVPFGNAKGHVSQCGTQAGTLRPNMHGLARHVHEAGYTYYIIAHSFSKSRRFYFDFPTICITFA